MTILVTILIALVVWLWYAGGRTSAEHFRVMHIIHNRENPNPIALTVMRWMWPIVDLVVDLQMAWTGMGEPGEEEV